MLDKKLVLLSLMSMTALAMRQKNDESHPKEQFCHFRSPQQVTSFEYLKKLRDEHGDCLDIIDIGCRDGAITAHIAQLFESAYVNGIDESEQLLQAARKKYSKPHPGDSYPMLKFRAGAVHDLQYENLIDIITLFGPMNWEKNKEAAMKKIARALRPKGVLLMTAGGDIDMDQHPLFRAFEDLRKIEPWSRVIGAVNPKEHYFPLKKAVAEKLVMDAGLHIIETIDRPRTVTFKNFIELEGLISSWFGGFKSFEYMPENQKKLFMAELVRRFLHYNKPNDDGTIDYSGRHLMVKAQK